MTKIGQKYLAVLGILLGLLALFLGLRVGISVLLPALYSFPEHWLPEDALSGLWFVFWRDWLIGVPSAGLSAVLLTFSFWLRPEDLPSGAARGIPASQALTRFSVLSIAASSVFALIVLFAVPWAEAQTAQINFRAEQTRSLEEAYLKLKATSPSAVTTENLEARMNLVKRLATLRPEQSRYAGNERIDYDFELQILKSHLEMEEFFRLRATPEALVWQNPSHLTIPELLTAAASALNTPGADNEFTANLLAYQAFRQILNAQEQRQVVSMAQLDQARQLIDQSWARIYDRTLLADERRKASYYFRKGKSLGDFQFQNYLEAYYGFQELHQENPRDPEVARYLTLSRDHVRDSVMFVQDLDVLFDVPGTKNLVFANRTNPPEIVRIGQLLDTSQGVYFKDLEVFRFSPQGAPLLHWQAPYGKWEASGMEFRVWDKFQPLSAFPKVLWETPDNRFDPTPGVSPPTFQPTVSLRDLQVLNNANAAVQTIGTWELLTESQAIEALGYPAAPLQTEFYLRLAAPFGFFLVFLFVFAISWHFRAHKVGRSWWLLFPLLPLVADFAVQTGLWAARLGVGGLISGVGITTATWIGGGVFVGLSVGGIILVWRQFLASTEL